MDGAPGLGQGLHDDFDLGVTCAAGDVHGAEHQGLAGSEEGFTLQRGLANDWLVRD